MTLAYKGIEINYHVSGKGSPIVFLHGFLENLTMWDEIVSYFSDTYTCITIDLLGHGKTDCIGYIHRMEDMAEAVDAVINNIITDQPVLIGHSMGGYVSLAYLDLFPKKLSGLVLLNSTSFSDSEERKINRSRAIGIVKKNPNAYTSMAIANLFAKENRIKYKSQIEKIKDEASKNPLQGIISALEGMKIRKDYTETLLTFNKPKIIFAGKKDPVLSYQQNLEESKLCNTDFISFEGGHMSYIENKDDLLKSLDQFLSNK
ncbi:Pimeloyl-ACP methyl ester carboxylesterase [Aquimarina amphilecti]|uniref:Pimeloyl-ACP methyl ester carboxylesterase n=1 Tax=Aquimarina amphilecti TaxID=1038014 RepID=A0A1H7K1X1_AQUAM|nr:alpha/beta hydrolase [Aquimarina amphilecti]SEK80931.1 Pimeloyl-ACP methyl ester carboxylesterase [Aquimarina amphilecti]